MACVAPIRRSSATPLNRNRLSPPPRPQQQRNRNHTCHSPPTPCKFWLQGNCTRGGACRFSHAADASPQNTTSSLQEPPLSSLSTKITNAISGGDEEKVKGQQDDSGDNHQQNEAPQSSSMPSPPQISAAATGLAVVSWPATAVTGEDGSLYLWNAESNEKQLMHMLPSPATRIVDGRLLHPGILLLLLASGDIALWNAIAGGGGLIAAPPQFGKALSALPARTRSQPVLFAGHESGAILCWAIRGHGDPELCAMQHNHAAPLLCLAASSNEGAQLLYSASADGAIAVWDMDTFSCLQLLQPTGGGAAATKIVAVGRNYVFAGCTDGSIKVWGAGAGGGQMQLLHTQEAPRKTGAAVVDMCGPVTIGGGAAAALISGYSDGSMSMWEVPSFKEVGMICDPTGMRAMKMVENGGSGGGRVLMVVGGQGSVTYTQMAI